MAQMSVLLVATVSMATVLLSAPTPAEAGVMGDYHWRTHVPTPEQEAYMARYITASRINYPKRVQALDALQMMHKGQMQFLEEMRNQADRNNKKGRNKEDQYSGDLGMLCYQQLEEEAAVATFDVRLPVTRNAHTVIGPICTSYGCALYAVYERYRKSFFSQEWLDVEAWCAEQEMEMGQFLQSMNGQDIMQMVARVWPHDAVRDRKGKLAQVQADLSRMKHGDPSTLMNKQDAGKRPMDKEKHENMMSIRNEFFTNVITPAIIKVHPEVFALSLDEIIKSGWVADSELAKYGYDAVYGSTEGKIKGGGVVGGEDGGDAPQPTYGDDGEAIPTTTEEYDEKDEF